jgi:protein-tyrosine phosphatase
MFIPLNSVENIRDLGGIKTSDGKTIKYKKLLRSADLHRLTKDELVILKEQYDLKEVLDFRSTRSFVAKKDLLDESIEYHHILVLKELEKVSYIYGKINDTPDEFFKHIYRSLALQEEAIETWRKFFNYVLKNDDGAILYHCTSGKDRTGIATIILLYVLGCSKETIIEEHMRTNEYTKPQFDSYLKNHPNCTKSEYDYYEDLYVTKLMFLDEYFRVINNQYGSFDNYIKNALKISDADRVLLRKKYLE